LREENNIGISYTIYSILKYIATPSRFFIGSSYKTIEINWHAMRYFEILTNII
jgi:hypothetical protein